MSAPIWIKFLIALLPILVSEVFMRYGMERDTDQEILNAGTFKREPNNPMSVNEDQKDSIKRIIKRRQKIIASFVLSYSIFSTGFAAIMKDGNLVLKLPIVQVQIESIYFGLVGLVVGAILIGLTMVLTERIRGRDFNIRNFERNDKIKYLKPIHSFFNGYWKAFVFAPIRTVVYLYNALFLLSAG